MIPWLQPLLDALGIDNLSAPERLPWLLLVAGGALVLLARRKPKAIAWPGLVEAQIAGARQHEPVAWIALLLRGGCLAALAMVLARPVAIDRAPPEPGLGLDIVLVLDTSGSMRALDAAVRGNARTRLDLAVEVVTRFATERVADGDRVGLVVFGESAFTQCPLTSDGELLSAALARVDVGIAGEATALGDALALAVKRSGGAPTEATAGRLVVLLTDGRSNSGSVPVDVATEIARSSGVRVHTVAIGTGGEEVAMAAAPGAPSSGLRFERHDVDRATLEDIATRTGGRAYAARRSDQLGVVYDEIDALERHPRPLPPRIRETGRAEPLVAAALGLLALEIALARVLRRRLP